MNVRELFQHLQNKEVNPYPYQEVCAEKIQRGGNLVVSAPTGAGKTWAALLGYLQSFHNGTPVADKVFYVLPMRTLANSLYESVSDSCRHVFDVTNNPEDKRKNPDKLAITIQTGEKRNDPLFEGDIIFTTIDQFLSAYLNIPLSLPPKLSNINAGALIGSLVILDEVHLLAPERSLATVVEMTERLKNYTQFIVMTATMSKAAMHALTKQLQGELITVGQDELQIMPSHKDKERRYKWTGQQFNAESVLRVHNRGLSIVICNTVARAQGIYRQLKASVCGDRKLFLLHSRFLRKDRQRIEQELGKYFGPDAPFGSNAILVTTQVVEVGIDISADNLHTELCPANSLIQRAGRTARYPSPRNRGTVWVYELETTETGKPRLGPYRDEIASAAVGKTRENMQHYTGQTLGFADEQKIIENVHGTVEKEIFATLAATKESLRRDVSLVINNADRSKASERIRYVDNIGVIITENPEELDLDCLPEMISVPRTTILGTLSLLVNNASETEWVIKYPVISELENGHIQWKIAKSSSELSWMAAISPRYVNYSAELGLELGVAGVAPALGSGDRQPWLRYSYEYETFKAHVRSVIEELRSETRRTENAKKRIGKTLGLGTNIVAEIAEVAAALHDTGKLRQEWQDALKKWQYAYYPGEISDAKAPLAHTTYRPEADGGKDKMMLTHRGSHAAEGAYAVQEALLNWLDSKLDDPDIAYDIKRVMITVIARHHHGLTEKMEKDVEFIKEAALWVNDAMIYAGLEFKIQELLAPKRSKDRDDLTQEMIEAQRDYKWLPLYWHMVRQVRLADQYAVKNSRR